MCRLTQALWSPSAPFSVFGTRSLGITVRQTVILIASIPGDRFERGPVVFQSDRTVFNAV